jgi:alpha-beta hydrolase superfamily lysophospholipase
MMGSPYPRNFAASIFQGPTETLITDDGVRLHLRHWYTMGVPRGTVQIVHGLGEHIERYDELALALNAAGWHVAGHDLRGHGSSGGPRGRIAGENTMLADLSAVVDHLRGTGRHILLGHSLGGLIAARFVAESMLNNASRWSRDVDGLVLSSPALDAGIGRTRRWLTEALVHTLPNLPLRNGLNPEWLSRDPEVVDAYVKDPLVHRRITPRLVRFILQAGEVVRRRAPRWRTPTLLMWAGADRCVSPAGSAAFAKSVPRHLISAREYTELRHEIFNEPERQEVIDQLKAWLARF